MSPRIPLLLLAASAGMVRGQSHAEGQAFLKQYCAACHSGKGAGGFALSQVSDAASLGADAGRWQRVIARVATGEMPPKGSPAPAAAAKEAFTNWVEAALHTEACAAGITPGAAPVRRLNRDEYTATVNDLLDIHLDIGSSLPVDGAGGEGFDNAAETLFLSPLHSEKYLETAKLAMDFAAKEYKSRTKILIARPGPGVTPNEAARRILANFLPQAFRRPVTRAEVDPYVALFEAATKAGQEFEPAVFFALRGVLVSPYFLYRYELPNPGPKVRPVDQYALASRLSYFLWGSMPDEMLFDLAGAGKLQDPEVLRIMIKRMVRHDRFLTFSKRFVEQWLRTRELSVDKIPDAKLYPTYAMSEDLRGDIRMQPILFFREIFYRNLPVTDLIESDHTIGTRHLAKHFDVELPLDKNRLSQPQWVKLPAGSHRGGVLGMPAVQIVSSYPYRTSPVLRGTWVLEAMLGTPPPPPPANVPPLEESAGKTPKSVRERLTQHRANAVCASCHNRIDPLGFALENYDPIGRWRTEDAGKPIDNSGELIDGTRIAGPEQLKQALLDRKDLFLRNLTNKLLGYALGRGLTLRDSCTVDNIMSEVKAKDYRAEALLEAIVLSVPFRVQAVAPPAVRSALEQKKP